MRIVNITDASRDEAAADNRPRVSARPTQKDIALAAGVSQAAVSMVLNKSETPSVPQATRARILKLAGELGYQPNHPARMSAQRPHHGAGLRHSRYHQPVLSGPGPGPAIGRGARRL